MRGRTGRGDTCTSAYLGKRLTASPAEATIWAAALTSLKMEAEGPFSREIGEVEELIRVYRKTHHYVDLNLRRGSRLLFS